ncbi:hypothetical protein FRC02_003014 [Tulasnella sp. 418]|nr:hypothetical protein FRC02_003014 [Tulasnella sp. 418]
MATPNTSEPKEQAKTKSSKPTWYPPATSREYEEPILKVLNSLTKEKVEFRPMYGKSVKWYNCGPTVYDAAHLGHARNYVSQDIIRRILIDYFGFDVHFVMNITDIDDKIIIRARQNHLLDNLRQTSTALTQELVSQVIEAWDAFFTSKLLKSIPNVPLPATESPEDLQASWDQINDKEKSDVEWWNSAKAADEKFTLNVASLRSTQAGLIAAIEALKSGDSSQEQAQVLIDASKDVLASYLDKKYGSTLTDHSISRTLSSYWENEFMKDMERLRVLSADTVTRVTEYVPEIVSFVERIVKNGYGYATDDGSVYFDVNAFDGGKGGASQKQQEEWSHFYAKLQPTKKGNEKALEEGEGALSTGASKRHPADFALWKASKPGEPAWPSPWGPGRPGWHIECSVMATEILGENMDIHSGGIDLEFPHHDNEIAQSEAFHDCRQWVNYFLHTGHLHIEGSKMSKSLKNFITVQDALAMYTPRQLRLAFLGQLWSSPMDFKEATMTEAKSWEATLNNFFSVAKALILEQRSKGAASDGKHHYEQAEKDLAAQLRKAQYEFRQALSDSFNTPQALDRLLDIVSKTNVYLARGRSNINVAVVETVANWVTKMLRMFGLGEGPVHRGTIGWGDAESGEGSGAVDREVLLLPYLQVLSTFRDNVRQLARQQAPSKETLELCDKLRDEDLAPLGVALDDQDDGKALVKLVNPETLLKAREEKAAAAAAKAAKKAAQAETERAKRRARMEKGKIPPTEMFQVPNVPANTYGSYDENGVPLTDAEGAELAKAKLKKLKKDWDIQKKAHDDYNEWVNAGMP